MASWSPVPMGGIAPGAGSHSRGACTVGPSTWNTPGAQRTHTPSQRTEIFTQGVQSSGDTLTTMTEAAVSGEESVEGDNPGGATVKRPEEAAQPERHRIQADHLLGVIKCQQRSQNETVKYPTGQTGE